MPDKVWLLNLLYKSRSTAILQTHKNILQSKKNFVHDWTKISDPQLSFVNIKTWTLKLFLAFIPIFAIVFKCQCPCPLQLVCRHHVSGCVKKKCIGLCPWQWPWWSLRTFAATNNIQIVWSPKVEFLATFIVNSTQIPKIPLDHFG